MRCNENNVHLYIIVVIWLTVIVMLNEVVVVIGDDDHVDVDGLFTRRQKSKCDMSSGSWVPDYSYPLYDSSQCPFIFEKFDCRKNDRPDESYLKYRWRPSSCEMPKFNGRDFLRRMRGQKIMFVGDILSMNQWQSLVCMFHTSHSGDFVASHKDGISNFEFTSMKVSVQFDHNREFLVDIVNEADKGRVLKLDSMTRGDIWKKQDVLIFNMWRSWLHLPMGKKWDYIETSKRKPYKSMDRLVAIEKMLNTWTKWVDKNVDLSKTKVFFVGPVPTHRHGYEWGNSTARNCAMERGPVNGSKYPTQRDSLEMLVRRKLKSLLRKEVYLLDVTLMSQLRKDGHPGVYGSTSHTKMDCDRWCLPGVPDTWNELLYAAMLQN